MTAPRSAYSSRSVGIVALVPYLVLQFKGLGIIVATASYGAIPSTVGDLDRRRCRHGLCDGVGCSRLRLDRGARRTR